MLVLGIYIKNVLLSAYLGCRGGGVGGGVANLSPYNIRKNQCVHRMTAT